MKNISQSAIRAGAKELLGKLSQMPNKEPVFFCGEEISPAEHIEDLRNLTPAGLVHTLTYMCASASQQKVRTIQA